MSMSMSMSTSTEYSARQATSIARQVVSAKMSKCLTLSQLSLHSIPREIFELTDLVRLDLGHNHLKALPSQIGLLTNLQQLWLNNNPLDGLPKDLQNCVKLKQLDLCKTNIKALPRELGRINGLVDVDILDIPLKEKLANAHAAGGTGSLMKTLKAMDLKKQLKKKLQKKLTDGIYREVADMPGARDAITALVKQLFKEFTKVAEQRSLIRNCERLLPEDLKKANAKRVHETFVTLRRENEKKKLMAEVELKLRAVYFNRIASHKVEQLLYDIAEVFETLEDVQFLLKHAKILFPQDVPNDTKNVFVDMVTLRNKLEQERQDALGGLHKALRSIYHEIDPSNVQILLDKVGACFRKTEELRKLASDATNYFPVEFESCDATSIRQAFVQQRRAMSGF